MNDMDVLIGRIKSGIQGCKAVIKSKTMPESTKKIAEHRIEAYENVLEYIKEITTVG